MNQQDIYIHTYIHTHTHTHIYKEIYYKELAHSVMEAKMSQDLELVSWRPRRDNGRSSSVKGVGVKPRKG